MIHGIQMTEQSMETKIAVLEAKVEHMMVHTKELTLRVRANEKVVASISLLGVIACTFIGAGYFAPKAEACSPRLDGEPTYCPPWDTVILEEPKGITDQTFEDNLDPDVFDHNQYEVTIFDSRDDDPFNVAHTGHSFPTWPTAGEMIEAIRQEEAKRNRNSIEEMLNNTLMEYEYGSDGSTESEELLQLPSDRDQSGFRW